MYLVMSIDHRHANNRPSIVSLLVLHPVYCGTISAFARLAWYVCHSRLGIDGPYFNGYKQGFSCSRGLHVQGLTLKEALLERVLINLTVLYHITVMKSSTIVLSNMLNKSFVGASECIWSENKSC